jgi:hypothetical protein
MEGPSYTRPDESKGGTQHALSLNARSRARSISERGGDGGPTRPLHLTAALRSSALQEFSPSKGSGREASS